MTVSVELVANRLTPLNSFVAVELTKLCNCWNSVLYSVRSLSDLVLSRESIANSPMRRNAPSRVFMNPSWVWVQDIPFPIFDSAESTLLIWPFKRDDTAKPAASSFGFTILEPELNRASDRESILLLSLRILDVLSAWMFVLIIITLNWFYFSFLFRIASMSFLVGPAAAARLLSRISS